MDVDCPMCGGRVIGHGIRKVRLTDIPYVPGCATVYEIYQHRYRCKGCGGTFCESNPFKAPGMNLTKRCVTWIFELMKYKEPLIYSAAHLRHIFSRLLLAEKLDVHPVHLEFFAIADEKICTESVPPH